MRPYLRQEGLAPKPGTLPPSVFLLMIPVPQPTQGLGLGPFFPYPQEPRIFVAYIPDSFPIPSPSSLTVWKERGLSPSVPCLSPSRLLSTPQEGAEVGLKGVKSTSAAFLWSLVIQRAGWGESTGKKEGGGKATRDILYNSKEQRSL